MCGQLQTGSFPVRVMPSAQNGTMGLMHVFLALLYKTLWSYLTATWSSHKVHNNRSLHVQL